MFVSPHKITVDKDGNLWVADNGLKDAGASRFSNSTRMASSCSRSARLVWLDPVQNI